MTEDFLQKIPTLEPSKHIFKDSRGSEENAKVKFIVPQTFFVLVKE